MAKIVDRDLMHALLAGCRKRLDFLPYIVESFLRDWAFPSAKGQVIVGPVLKKPSVWRKLNLQPVKAPFGLISSSSDFSTACTVVVITDAYHGPWREVIQS
jgi:hypothetical protein